MSLTCTNCSRVNPPDAIYCYFDGVALNGQGLGRGPVAAGSKPFASPFVFPSGRTCRSFDELAIASCENWPEAIDALGEGYLTSFLRHVGRADLAQAAAKAAKFPDKNRGLDELLGKLPSAVLEEPKLSLESKEINLGELTVGQDRELALSLVNHGMRLLYGNVNVIKSPWLALGEPPGKAQKFVQFIHDLSLPLHVRGEKLRASSKPLVGKLIVDTNGGTETIVVKATVPLQTFPDGVLAGAETPRAVALIAKEKPKEAAPLFERGDVARWYKSNGWTYPVEGPSASGMGAIQQFFEALGLTKPPRVTINKASIELQGAVGQPLYAVLEVKTREKRPVYAHGKSNQPWLEVHDPQLKGRVAKIPIAIPMVPHRPGEQLTAKVIVQANGNQRFVVPVTVYVEHNLDFTAPAAETQPERFAPAPVALTPELVVEPNAEPIQEKKAKRTSPAIPVLVPEPIPEPAADIAAATVNAVQSAPTPLLVPVPTPASAFPAPRAATAVPPVPASVDASPQQREQPASLRHLGISKTSSNGWAHAIPGALLAMILMTLVIVDLASESGTRKSKEELEGAVDVRIDPTTGAFLFTPRDATPRLLLKFNEEGERFGLSLAREKDPANPRKKKRLTYDEEGRQNNTIVKLDNFEYYFGREIDARIEPRELKGEFQVGRITKMFWKGGRKPIEITQHVQLMPGGSGALDTCLVYYKVTNTSKSSSHTVGLRVMLDTFIGANDGVPFTVPGEDDFVRTRKILNAKDMPSYVEVVERPDDSGDPGTVVRMELKGIELPGLKTDEKGRQMQYTIKPEPIHKMVICRWPGTWTRWDWEYQSMIPKPNEGGARDSCVALYWEEQPMNPGETRHFAFTYGLSSLSFGPGSKDITLRVPDNVRQGDEMTVTAYVYNARRNQRVQLHLPEGFELAPKETADKSIESAGARSVVNWSVIAPNKKVDSATIRATSGTSEATIKVEVKGKSIFG